MVQKELHLREKVGRCIQQALFQVCGGGFQEEEERKQLFENSLASISFPNKNSSSAGGKPHDIEVRVALTLFHRWKRAASGSSVNLVSDLGLTREVSSPRNLAEVLFMPLEEACRDQGIAHDVRFQPSGMICIVTYERSQMLRQAGKLPCPHCIQWCKGNSTVKAISSFHLHNL
jgi:hypothetical protein